jgi:para-aminobenzoate synthetase/4-amino-4-deoxychorismate lyase
MDDVILWNRSGEVTESCTANVVADFDGELVTPPVRCGLLAGTFRGFLLEKGRIVERVIPAEELPRARRLYLVNSVREWMETVLERD